MDRQEIYVYCGLLYIFQIFLIYIYQNTYILINYLITLILLILIWIYISNDTKKKELNSTHVLWSFLGIIGLIIYDVGFSTKN
jgi:TctA family transporter